jgi:4-hydroxy-4-methyl-2-oxoglutarate aldolase
MKTGQSYRSQVRFSEYVTRREKDATYGFRQHLKEVAAASEA